MHNKEYCIYNNSYTGYEHELFLLRDIFKLTSSTISSFCTSYINKVKGGSYEMQDTLNHNNLVISNDVYKEIQNNGSGASKLRGSETKSAITDNILKISYADESMWSPKDIDIADKTPINLALELKGIAFCADMDEVAYAECVGCPYVYLIDETELKNCNGSNNYLPIFFKKLNNKEKIYANKKNY